MSLPTISARRKSAFLICRFWLIDALWEDGRQDEARDMFVDALRIRNRYGLLSEDVHPVTGKLWGNFPQTYSMSGLIFDGNQAVAKLGRPVLARLVVVSNRVGIPDRGATARRTRSRDPGPRSSVTVACGLAGADALREVCRNPSRS